MSNWKKIFGDNKPQVISKDKDKGEDTKEKPPKVKDRRIVLRNGSFIKLLGEEEDSE